MTLKGLSWFTGLVTDTLQDLVNKNNERRRQHLQNIVHGDVTPQINKLRSGYVFRQFDGQIDRRTDG